MKLNPETRRLLEVSSAIQDALEAIECVLPEPQYKLTLIARSTSPDGKGNIIISHDDLQMVQEALANEETAD